MQKIDKGKKIPPFHNIISEREIQQQRNNMSMVKVHFLTRFDTQLNRVFYLEYSDRFEYLSFPVPLVYSRTQQAGVQSHLVPNYH